MDNSLMAHVCNLFVSKIINILLFDSGRCFPYRAYPDWSIFQLHETALKNVVE